jgi:hypothetical protein
MESRYHYDVPTAVTFLLAGLGVGSLLTLLFSNRFEKFVSVRATADRDEPVPVR